MFRRRNELRRKGSDDVYAAIATIILLIIVAMGNPKTILIFSVTGFIVGLVVFKGRISRGGLFVAMVGFAAASAIAV